MRTISVFSLAQLFTLLTQLYVSATYKPFDLILISFKYGIINDTYSYLKAIIFSMAQQPLAGQGLLIIEASRSHITLGRSPLDEESA
jgi:hypothetical protein